MGFSGRYCMLENNVIMTKFIDFDEIIVGESRYMRCERRWKEWTQYYMTWALIR